jgi:hypothetical protein
MGSVTEYADDHCNGNYGNGTFADRLPSGHADGDNFKSVKVFGLASDQPTSRTGMREEVLLASWLLVLMRTREDSQVRYDWAYIDRAHGDHQNLTKRSLAENEVLSNRQDSIGQLAEAISRHITTGSSGDDAPKSGGVSLFLSTDCESAESEAVKKTVSSDL